MAEAVRHFLRIRDPEHHRVEIESRFPAGAPRDVFMPVWTPGSYLVREYARHVETLAAEASDGAALPAAKTAKNRWRVEAPAGEPFVIRYRLYGRELTVRTNFVDRDFALFQGPATFLCGVGDGARAHHVTVETPSSWTRVACALPEDGGGYRAADFDALADAPIYAGSAEARGFRVAGREHLLIVEGADALWDAASATRDCAAIAETLHRLWGFLPYDRYFLLQILAAGASGGLEHRDCAVLLADPFAVRTRKGYLEWLALVAHEMFHAWNVKRLRPRALGPFDYEAENPTPSLWVAEGVTRYYDDLLVHRSGLSSRKEYLRALGKQLADLENVPGRAVQSLRDASFDAWIKYYRQDENTVNSAVSYYVKGAVVAFLLDVRLRRETAGRASLDTVLRLAYDRWSGARGFAEEEFRATAEEIAGADLGEFFGNAVDTVAELDLEPAFEWFGLRRRAKPLREDEEAGAWLGAKAKNDEGRLVVQEVRRDSPAWRAGLAPGDEIVGLAGHRVLAGKWEERLRSFRPAETAELLVARRGRLLPLAVTFAAPPDVWTLEVDAAATAEQKARLESWLQGNGSA
jgi:predicted metalloprotease with PDZ domain